MSVFDKQLISTVHWSIGFLTYQFVVDRTKEEFINAGNPGRSNEYTAVRVITV